MEEKSLHFPSVTAICQFLREMNCRNFVLLGKRTILIAPFTAEELALAARKYCAKLTETAEAKLLTRNISVAGS